MVELGITTFGETTPLESTGATFSHSERIQQLVKEIELADQVGLDVYAIGEHHRKDFAVSAPEIVLAAGAARTKHIKLSPAVTVLSSQDPVRVFQQYSTIDAISNGRAEIMVGRGSFTESFPLFGYDLRDYEELFNEKLDMLLTIARDKILTWNGNHTQSVSNTPIYPRPVNGEMPIWVATGGNPESTIRIAKLGLPIAYATIGGNPLAFRRLTEAYREIGREMGHDPSQLKVAANSWGFIMEDKQEAIDRYFQPTKEVVDAISRDRSFWRPLDKQSYLQMVAPDGAMFVGDPDTVAEKIIYLVENLNLDRFLLHVPLGSMPHEDVMKSIELYGKVVAPKVRKHFENR